MYDDKAVVLQSLELSKHLMESHGYNMLEKLNMDKYEVMQAIVNMHNLIRDINEGKVEIIRK